MAIPKTIVEVGPSGELLVEISIGDTLDKDGARQGIRFAVVLPSMGENPSLSAIQIAAINRALVLLDETKAALAPRTSAD
jgi:hypothetical protein